MAFKPIDPKRDEFRRYLERAGVVEALTKVFVRIVKERPENPIEYLRHNLGDSLQQADNMAYLQSELEESRVEIQRLRDIIESINPEALEEDTTQLQPPPPSSSRVNEEVQEESAVEDQYHKSHVNGVAEISSDLETEVPSQLSTNEVADTNSASTAATATAVEDVKSFNNDVQNEAATTDAANFANEASLTNAK